MVIKMLISVIIPVFNVSGYLARCVESVCNQTYKDIEIILVDDGSTDNSLDICNQMQKKYSTIRVFHKENGGLSSARNMGLDNARGEYICFIDSDDWIEPDFCSYLVDMATGFDSKLSVCSISKDSTKTEIIAYHGEKCISQIEALHFLDTRESMEYLCTVISCNKLYHKSLFKDIRYPDNKWHEDEFVIVPVLLQNTKICITDRPMYHYVCREDSITGESARTDIRHLDVIDAYENRMCSLSEYGDLFCIAWRNCMLCIIEYIEKGNFDKHVILNLKKRYRNIFFKYKNIPVRYKLKYGLYLLFPKIYKAIFYIRNI